MKLKIKDIFLPEINFINPEENTIEEQAEKPRMLKLIELLEQKDIVLKEEKSKKVDENKLKVEAQRMKKLTNEWSKPSNFNGHAPNSYGLTNSVNAYTDTKGQTVNSFFDVNNNPNSMNVHNPNFTYLSDGEALRVAISRTLNSGDPTVTKLGFYEEINMELNKIGFSSKSPLDIKQMVIKMCKG